MPDINTVVVTPTVSVVQVNNSVPGSFDTTARLGLHWMDVTDPLFGATGDGVTDDSAAIQAAHDALPSTGGILYFPPGVYVCTGLTISKTSVGLIGPPSIRAARLQFNSTTGTLFTITGALFSIRGFDINSASAHSSGSVFDIQAGQGTVDNIRLGGSFWDVFKMETDGAGGWFFNDLRVAGGFSMNSLFRVKGTASSVADNHVTNILAATNTSYSDAVVILDTYVDTFRMTGGTLGGNATNGIVNVRHSGGGVRPRYIRFTNIFFEGSAGTGDALVIDDGDDIKVTDSYIALCRKAFVVNGGRDIVLHTTNVLSIPNEGVDLNGGSRVDILDNHFLDIGKTTDVTYSVVDVAAAVSEWRVERNTNRLRSGSTNKPLRGLTVASGVSTKYVYGANDWGVAGTDFGAAGATPISDGGTGTNVAIADGIPGALYRGGTATSHTGTTSPTVLRTVTIPAGALRVRDAYRVVCAGTTSGTAGTKTLTVAFGGSTVSTIGIPQANTDTWQIEAVVEMANATGNQSYSGIARRGVNDTEGAVTRPRSGALTVDTTSDVAVTLTATLGNSGDTIVVRTFDARPLRR